MQKLGLAREVAGQLGPEIRIIYVSGTCGREFQFCNLQPGSRFSYFDHSGKEIDLSIPN